MKKLIGYMGLIIFIIAGLGLGSVFYAFKIEPYRLTVKEYDLGKTSDSKAQLKIVQFSDVHIKSDFTYQNLDKIVDKINQQQADVVVFTGDLYDNYAQYNDDGQIINSLQRIQANYAKIAIWGNHDYGGGGVRNYQSVIEESDFTLLRNESTSITTKENKELLFTGVDDSLFSQAAIDENVMATAASYKVLLTHEPDIMKDFPNQTYDLTLSGHSHGGQINIPFLPMINKEAVSKTVLSEEYSGGMYDLVQGNKLYVSSGIGTTHISARLGVTPEIAVFNINL